MAETFWQKVNRGLKIGMSATDIVDAIGEDRPESLETIGQLRESGLDDREIIGQLEPIVSGGQKAADPYKTALKSMGAAERAFVPLGSAFGDIYYGVKQIAGDEQSGITAADANRALDEEYPGARIGAKVAVTAPVIAATAPIAAGMAGAGGVLARAGVAGVTAGGLRSLDPMGSNENRAVEAAKAGALGAVASPVAEVTAAGLSKVATKVAGKLRSARVNPTDLHTETQLKLELKSQGIDWSALGKDMQDAIKKATQRAVDGVPVGVDGLDDAIKRAAQAQSLKVPVRLTQGQATRVPEQQLDENQLLPYSPELKKALDDQRLALQQNLDLLGSGGTPDRLIAGASQKEAMGAKLQATKQAVSDAYKAAEAQAGGTVVSPEAFVRWLWDNRANPGVAPLISKMKDIGALTVKEGKWEAGKVALKDLYKVRSTASALGKGQDQTAHFAGQAKRVIDETFEESGGEAYKAAASLRRAQSAQFDERAVPAVLTGRKGQEDAIADDDVVGKIISQPIQKILDYRQAAIRGNEQQLAGVFKTPELRKQGVQALRDLRAATVQYLKIQAGGKDFSAESLVTAYEKLGRGDEKIAYEKAAALMGPKAAKELREIVNAARNVSYDSDFIAKGSARFNTNIAKKFGDWLTKISPSDTAAQAILNLRAQSAGSKAAQFNPESVAGAPVGRRAAARVGSLAASQEAERRAP